MHHPLLVMPCQLVVLAGATRWQGCHYCRTYSGSATCRHQQGEQVIFVNIRSYSDHNERSRVTSRESTCYHNI